MLLPFRIYQHSASLIHRISDAYCTVDDDAPPILPLHVLLYIRVLASHLSIHSSIRLQEPIEYVIFTSLFHMSVERRILHGHLFLPADLSFCPGGCVRL